MSPQRIITIILFVGLSSYYFVTWRNVRAPLSDFLPIYAAARLMQADQNPYDVEAQCRVQSAVRTDLCMPFNHTPVLLPLVSLITTENYAASYTRWCLLLVIVLAVTSFIAYRLSENFDASLQAILFLPVFISITQGQDTAFVLLGVFVWAWLLKTNYDFWAGVALILTIIKPQIALLFGVPMIVSRQRAFVGFCVGGLTAVVFSLYLVGIAGFRGLIEIVRISATGQTFGVNHMDMYSAVGMFARAGLSPYWAWLVFVLGLFALCLLWRKYGVDSRSRFRHRGNHDCCTTPAIPRSCAARDPCLSRPSVCARGRIVVVPDIARNRFSTSRRLRDHGWCRRLPCKPVAANRIDHQES